jgi:hypothetical protein
MNARIDTRRRGPQSLWVSGLTAFAGVILLSVGIFQILEGLAAVINDDFLVVVRNYAFALDVTTWGWLHMLLGAVAVAVGVFILQGAPWARAIGIVIAGLSAIANFLFIPYYPLWALLIIALDVAVIWALAVYDPERA